MYTYIYVSIFSCLCIYIFRNFSHEMSRKLTFGTKGQMLFFFIYGKYFKNSYRQNRMRHFRQRKIPYICLQKWRAGRLNRPTRFEIRLSRLMFSLH